MPCFVCGTMIFNSAASSCSLYSTGCARTGRRNCSCLTMDIFASEFSSFYHLKFLSEPGSNWIVARARLNFNLRIFQQWAKVFQGTKRGTFVTEYFDFEYGSLVTSFDVHASCILQCRVKLDTIFQPSVIVGVFDALHNILREQNSKAT